MEPLLESELNGFEPYSTKICIIYIYILINIVLIYGEVGSCGTLGVVGLRWLKEVEDRSPMSL